MIKKALPVAAAVICALMGFDSDYRAVAYALLVFYIFSVFSLYITHAGRFGLRRVPKRVVFLISGLAFLFLKDIFLAFDLGKDVLSFSMVSLFNLLFVLAMFLSLSECGWRGYFLRWSLTLFLIGLLLSFVMVGGVALGMNDNYPAAMMVPFSIYYLCFSRRLLLVRYLPFFMAFVSSFYFEARAALAALLFATLMSFLLRRGWLLAYRLCIVIPFGALMVLHGYLAVDNSDWANIVLTYRPAIWNFYVSEAYDQLVLGRGPIDSVVAEGAAEAYGSYAERGVNDRYGPQSMYVRYFYESGFFGLFFIIFFAFLFSIRANFGAVVFASYVMLSFGESNILGTPSVYGMPLVIGLVLSSRLKSIKT